MAKKAEEAVVEQETGVVKEPVVTPVTRVVPEKFTELVDTLYMAEQQARARTQALQQEYLRAAQEYTEHRERLELALLSLDLVDAEKLSAGKYGVDAGQEKTVVVS